MKLGAGNRRASAIPEEVGTKITAVFVLNLFSFFSLSCIVCVV